MELLRSFLCLPHVTKMKLNLAFGLLDKSIRNGLTGVSEVTLPDTALLPPTWKVTLQ